MYEELYGSDGAERIALCLDCQRTRCTNCLSSKPATNKVRVSIDASQLVRLYNNGTSGRNMAAKLHVGKWTLYRRLRALDLSLAPPRPRINRKTFEALPDELRRGITWKGEPL